jgi:alpha-ketoglutarate-dependent 2,4-dichlorophenoxyacetate dioxygenase
MSWTLRSLQREFGAELTGNQVGHSLSAEDRRAVYDATARYGLTVIPRQHLSDRDLHDFFSSLGDPLFDLRVPNGQTPRAGGIVPLTNIDAAGNRLPITDGNVQQNRANELWHTDLTFQTPRATLSLLYARLVPPQGGDTEFCDTRLACEQLSATEREYLASLTCRHVGAHSRRKYGFTNWDPGASNLYPAVERPLTVTHLPTGRTALTIGSYVESIKGMSYEDSQALLDGLLERATAPENVYVHRWTAGDLLLWDNRCMLHRGRPFDLSAHRREMRAARLFDPANP